VPRRSERAADERVVVSVSMSNFITTLIVDVRERGIMRNVS
jgi:hypothetical protein